MKLRKGKRALATINALIEVASEHQGDVGDGGLMVIEWGGRARHYAPSAVTSAMRYALGRMQTSEKGDVPSRISVTSAISGEGVTFVASSLAVLLANDLQRSVCLVDLNWWSPGADSLPEPGVAQVLESTHTVDEVLVATKSPRLYLLPAGPTTPARRPVLAKSPELEELLEHLQTRFDHVVLDLPPVLTTGETLTLASLAEAFVLVVRHGVTAEQQVKAALEELHHLVSLGVVLNRSSSRVPTRLMNLLAE